MEKLQSYFKIGITKANGNPTVREIKYIGADGKEYTGLEFEGYASTGELDRGGDITLPSSFQNTLKSYMENAMMLLQHDDTKPIGNFTEVRIDGNGLFVKGLVKVDIDNVFQKLRTGVLKTMSIGYRIIDWATEKIKEGGEEVEAFVIKQLELFEISLVSVPMNAGAQIKNMSDNISDEDYKNLFQIEKDDTYSLTNSLMDLKIKKVDTFKDITTGENIKTQDLQNDILKEEIIEEVKEIETIKEKIEETEIIKDGVKEVKDNEIIDEIKEIQTKEYISLTIKEVMVGDMIRFIKKQDDWVWEEYNDEEILGDVKEADVGEIIKIDKNKTDGINTIWILKYELTMEGFKPTNKVNMFEFEEIEMIKVSNSQLKKIADKIAKQLDESEIKAGDIADESNKLESDVKDLKEYIKEEKYLDTKLFKENIIEFETKFNDYKEISSKEIKTLFEEEIKKFETKTEEFADVLLKALCLLEETNQKALEYVGKLENSPVIKSKRFYEKEEKIDNAFTNMIKSIAK